MKVFIVFSLIPYIFTKETQAKIQISPSTICPLECSKYTICDAQLGKCIYKGFWPIYPLEMLEIVVLSFSSALATTCGIGGGTVYSAFFMGVQNFEPFEAFPISNVLILSCGLMTYIVCVYDKYENPKNEFVDYEMALLFGPSMLLGTKLGTIFNKILSSPLLTIGVLIVLLYSITSTYKVVLREREAETLEELPSHNIEGEEHLQSNLREPLIDPINHEGESKPKVKENESVEKREILKQDENPIQINRIIFMIILEIFVIIDQFLEGSPELRSFVGITRCSMYYWIVFVIYVLLSLLWLWVAYLLVKYHFNRRQQVIPDYKTDKMDIISNNMSKIMIIGLIAGTVASMVGIGVGMITNPLFCTLGLNSKEATSTSNFLIIIASIASTFLFSLAGQLNYVFILWMIVPCTLSAYFGSSIVFKYINRTRKSSILLIIMLFFLVASLIVIVMKAYYDIKAGSFLSGIFKLNNYCKILKQR